MNKKREDQMGNEDGLIMAIRNSPPQLLWGMPAGEETVIHAIFGKLRL